MPPPLTHLVYLCTNPRFGMPTDLEAPSLHKWGLLSIVTGLTYHIASAKQPNFLDFFVLGDALVASGEAKWQIYTGHS